MRGSGCQIFCTPAVNVTATSQTSGINVISASAGFPTWEGQRAAVPNFRF